MSIWPPPTPADFPAIPVSAGPETRSPADRRYYEPYPPPDPYGYRPGEYERDGFGRDRYPEYDRERDWAEWDRRRGVTRGRSRSPGIDDGRLKRRRSPSPYERDRYDPRPRYDDDYRYGRPRSPPSHRGGAPRVADPWTMDFPTNFRHFSDWLRATHPEDYAEAEAAKDGGDEADENPNGLKARYEKYRRTIVANQISTLFGHHKNSPWFNERYNPADPYVSLRSRVKREGWNGLSSRFVRELEEGKHDPSVTVPKPPSNSLAPDTEDETRAGSPSGDIEMKTGGDEKLEGSAAGDESARDVGSASPDKSVTNGGTGRRPEGEDANGAKPSILRDDEVSVEPEGNQVLIRTLPPDIGRVKLERVCRSLPGFRHLALGDPMQKRNYYRAGWLRFDDDADMIATVNKLGEEKIEGFKLHVTHSTRSFVARIRYTADVASTLPRLEKDLGQAKRLIAMLEEESIALANLPAKLPEPRNLKKSMGGELPDDADDPLMDSDASPEVTDLGTSALEVIERRIEKLVGNLELEEDALATRKAEIALDLHLAYLRSAFNCCYYCAAITDHVEELQRKCIKHLRRPANAQDIPKDERWAEALDQKIELIINRDGVDAKEFGGKDYDEELAKAVEPHVKQEDEGKYRCKTCNKLFKANAFVQKHIATKHGELVKSLDEIPFFNNFALDPHRIQPFSHPPPPSGNGQQAPPEAYGLRSLPPSRGGSDRGPDPRARPGGYYPPPSHYPSYDYPPPRHQPYYPVPGAYETSRRSPPPSRRLSDRLGDYVYSDNIDRALPSSGGGYRKGFFEGAASLPAKPPVSTAILEPGPGARRMREGGVPRDPPPPPPDAKEDPRAAAGRKVSYHDMDAIAEGDVELTY